MVLVGTTLALGDRLHSSLREINVQYGALECNRRLRDARRAKGYQVYKDVRSTKFNKLGTLALLARPQSNTAFVLEARGQSLVNLDGVTGTSDPFLRVFVYLDNGSTKEVYVSEVVEDDLNPNWQEALLDTGMEYSESTMLEIRCYDYDEGDDDEFMGLVRMRLGQIMSANPVHFPLESDKRMDILHVDVLRATGLVAADRGGTSDPYVQLQVGDDSKRSKRTHVKNQTLCPVWNQAFKMRLRPEQRHHDKLVLECFDHDLVGGDDSLGKVEIALGDLVPGGEYSGTLALALEGVQHAGKLDVKYKLEDETSADALRKKLDDLKIGCMLSQDELWEWRERISRRSDEEEQQRQVQRLRITMQRKNLTRFLEAWREAMADFLELRQQSQLLKQGLQSKVTRWVFRSWKSVMENLDADKYAAFLEGALRGRRAPAAGGVPDVVRAKPCQRVRRGVLPCTRGHWVEEAQLVLLEQQQQQSECGSRCGTRVKPAYRAGVDVLFVERAARKEALGHAISSLSRISVANADCEEQIEWMQQELDKLVELKGDQEREMRALKNAADADTCIVEEAPVRRASARRPGHVSESQLQSGSSSSRNTQPHSSSSGSRLADQPTHHLSAAPPVVPGMRASSGHPACPQDDTLTTHLRRHKRDDLVCASGRGGATITLPQPRTHAAAAAPMSSSSRCKKSAREVRATGAYATSNGATSKEHVFCWKQGPSTWGGGRRRRVWGSGR